MKTARQITLDLLIRMDTQGAYSNIILDHAFTRESNLTRSGLLWWRYSVWVFISFCI